MNDRILATYWIETPHSVEHAAEVIAGEQSCGTFVRVPGETSELRARHRAQVERLERCSEPARFAGANTLGPVGIQNGKGRHLFSARKCGNEFADRAFNRGGEPV